MENTIRTNMISPKQAFQRNVAREKIKSMKILLPYVNAYLTQLKEAENDLEKVRWVFERQSLLWQQYSKRQNANPRKLAELRPFDFEDFINDHLKKHKIYEKDTWKYKKQKFFRACSACFRPLIDWFWLGSNKTK